MANKSETRPTEQATMAWARLLRVSRQFMEAAEVALKNAALPPLIWYDALHELAQAGNTGMRPFALENRMLLAQYSVSRLLSRLETEGLIERFGMETDGRGQTVRITQMGRDVRRRMWVVYGATIHKLVGKKLAENECLELGRLLGILRDPPVEG